MTPRKSTTKAFAFPASGTSPRLSEVESKPVPSLSDLLTKDANPMRNSDSLLMNKPSSVPKLQLETVFDRANEENDLGDFQTVEEESEQAQTPA